MNPKTEGELGKTPETKVNKDYKNNNQQSHVRTDEHRVDNRKVPSLNHNGKLKHDDDSEDENREIT